MAASMVQDRFTPKLTTRTQKPHWQQSEGFLKEWKMVEKKGHGNFWDSRSVLQRWR